jgi:hypothetical protein
MADIAWPLGKLKPIAVLNTGSSGLVLLKICLADHITIKLPSETTGTLKEYHRCFFSRKNNASRMLAGTKNSPVAKKVTNCMMRVFALLMYGRMLLKTPESNWVFSRPKMLLIINARLMIEIRNRRRTITSSIDKRAMLAINFLKCWTMPVSYSKKNAGIDPAFSNKTDNKNFV